MGSISTRMIDPKGLDPKIISGAFADVPGQVVRYVQSTHLRASNLKNQGKTRNYPLATLQKAIDLSAAYDSIIVLPGHVETVSVANGLTVNKVGLFIHGIGGESTRPQIKIGTVTTASVLFSAADVSLDNFNFVTDIDSLAQGLNVTAAGVKLTNFRWIDSASKQALVHVELAVGANYTRINGMRTDCETTGAVSAIKISGACDRVEITDCILEGSFSTANIHVTAAASRLTIGRNNLFNAAATAAILCGAVASSGTVFNNICSITGAITTPFQEPVTLGSAVWRLYNNYVTDGAGLTGILVGTVPT